jgi:hypothetical protein
MVRSFPEWANFQPERGKWDFSSGDGLIDSARKNRIRIVGVLCYLAPWASSPAPGADHGTRTRTFPIKDMRYWRDYVEGVVGRYHKDVKYWEVYNEFNSPAFARNASVKDYAAMVRQAHEAAGKVDPQCKIGIGCADVDISFLEQVFVQGAAGCVDFVNVHPYSLMGAVMDGRETVFLQMAANLRKMLAKCGQPMDMPLWVSEIGVTHSDRGDGQTVVAQVDGGPARRTDVANKRHYMYFDVDDSYASVGDGELDITVVARRVHADKAGGCKLCYESIKGYRPTREWWTVPAEEGWHEHTFQIRDANFANNWGWNFRIEAVSSPDDIWVRQVIVKRIGPKR